MKTLTELADKYKSDKGLSHDQGHGYTILYEDLFMSFRNKKITFLEIGLKKGGPELGGSSGIYRGNSPSIQMWLEYFGEKIDLVGFDISDFSSQSSQNFHFIMGDSGNDSDMKKLSESRDKFDIILEDASHNSYHQQNAIKYLWDKLSSGGLFIIEDLHWQPDKVDFGVPIQPKTLDLFHEYFNQNKYNHSDVISKKLIKKIKNESNYILLHKSSTSPGQVLVLKKK